LLRFARNDNPLSDVFYEEIRRLRSDLDISRQKVTANRLNGQLERKLPEFSGSAKLKPPDCSSRRDFCGLISE